MADKPHMVNGRPASTEEIAPVVRQHEAHAGIAYFGPECEQCVEERKLTTHERAMFEELKDPARANDPDYLLKLRAAVFQASDSGEVPF